ncbi:MAG: hypothetical protein JJE15_06505 [Desulfobacteraceae bacterium]|nr:hypothetical protein [Desulfobacteraceae bacterium]
MRRLTKKLMVIFVVGTLAFIPFGSPVMAQEQYLDEDTDPHMRMVGDILLIRPLGIVATVVGGALFVVSLPFSALGGNTEDVYQTMVVEPARFTFTRPIGDFK